MKQFARCATALIVVAAGSAYAAEDGKYANFGGVKIHYIDRGQGEPIVLLHGGTSSLDSWIDSGAVANLQKDFRVIAFDARGAGKSEKPRDPKAYGRQQALDVPRLLDHLKLDRAHIAGHSLGGSTVAQLLTLHPERFLTATLGASAGRSPEDIGRSILRAGSERYREELHQPQPDLSPVAAEREADRRGLSQARSAVPCRTRTSTNIPSPRRSAAIATRS